MKVESSGEDMMVEGAAPDSDQAPRASSTRACMQPCCSSARALAERSSMHGCQNIVARHSHVMRRVTWSVLLLGSAALFLNALMRGILHYRRYPSAVSVDIVPNRSLTLPDVTISNYNFIVGRKSFIDSWSPEIQAVLRGDRSKVIPDGGPDYGTFLKQGMDPLEKFISNCSNNHKPFDCANGTGVIMLWMGMAYTMSLSDHIQITNRPFDGLRLVITVNVSEYSEHYGMGIRLMLHEHGEAPDENRAVFLPPATDAHIAIRKARNVRLGRPYSTDDCLEAEDWHSDWEDSPYTVYTKQGCELDCFVRYFKDAANCSFSGESKTTRACTLKEAFTYNSEALNFSRSPQCSCLRPCQETIYSTDVTTLAHRDTPGELKNITVTILYTTFDVTVVTQHASYAFDAFLADVGGQMGLFLGASILTWTEILEFLLLCVLNKFVQPK